MSPADKSNMSKYLFGGFARCLYPTQKFQSDAERKLAVILEREALEMVQARQGPVSDLLSQRHEDLEYQPDFVAETETRIFMLEPKAANQMTDRDVWRSAMSPSEWCRQASDHAASYDGKPWTYVLIPHDAIAENMTLEGLARQVCTECRRPGRGAELIPLGGEGQDHNHGDLSTSREKCSGL